MLARMHGEYAGMAALWPDVNMAAIYYAIGR